jgi:hypothetical protein
VIQHLPLEDTSGFLVTLSFCAPNPNKETRGRRRSRQASAVIALQDFMRDIKHHSVLRSQSIAVSTRLTRATLSPAPVHAEVCRDKKMVNAGFAAVRPSMEY